MDPSRLHYGRQTVYEPGIPIYRQGEAPGERPIYYILAGLVKLELVLKEGTRFPMYLHPQSVFGLVEPLAGCPRLTHASAMERSIVYRWTPADFDLALGLSWELAMISITGLTRMLRILNAEFGERIGLMAAGAQA